MASCALDLLAKVTNAHPLDNPAESLRMLHSSMTPKGEKRLRTSPSLDSLLNIPTNNFLSVHQISKQPDEEMDEVVMMKRWRAIFVKEIPNEFQHEWKERGWKRKKGG